jgi:hypothetical protein
MWSGRVRRHEVEAELEPRWQRWRLAERTRHGLVDLGCATSLLDAQQQLADYVNKVDGS